MFSKIFCFIIWCVTRFGAPVCTEKVLCFRLKATPLLKMSRKSVTSDMYEHVVQYSAPFFIGLYSQIS